MRVNPAPAQPHVNLTINCLSYDVHPDVFDWCSRSQDAVGTLGDRVASLEKVLREVLEYLDYSNYATDSGDLPETVRAALKKT